MEYSITVFGKPVRLEVSRSAEKALNDRHSPLLANARLYFGCMPTKKVFFKDLENEEAVQVSDSLAIHFLPAFRNACTDDGTPRETNPTGLTITETDSLVPKWMKIDYRANSWVGEFGY